MREIAKTLQDIILGGGPRRPDYRIYAWAPGSVTISELVSANGEQVGEYVDLTPYASNVSWNDRQLSFLLTDPAGLFHPDFGEMRKSLADQAIVRLVEGDEGVPESDWIITFTGQVHGQIGWNTNRVNGDVAAKVTAFGRGETQAYKRRKITSQEYTVGTDLGIALRDICGTFMGLTGAEMRVPFTLGRQFKHKVNQLSQVTPWDAVSTLLQVVCYQPFFDGEGKLAYVNKSLNRVPARLFENGDSIVELDVPESSQDSTNKVVVTFLDSMLERVDGPAQKLGDAQVTTGFFSLHEALPVQWSEDGRQRASGTYMKVIKSVNSGLLPVGDESYRETSEFGGLIEVEISVWVPILATVMIAEYLAAAAIPDDVVVGGVVASMGITISVGRLIQAQAMIGILIIMMSIGSAQYEIHGTPYDYAYLQKKSVACVDGLDYWQEVTLEFRNDFIGTHDQADIIAMTELTWQVSLGKPRRVAVADDPRLEVGDIIGLPDGRKLVIAALSKSVRRGEPVTLMIEGCKVLTA